MTDYSFGLYWFIFFGLILARYLLIAGGAYWLFYSLLGKFFAPWALHRSKTISRQGSFLLEPSIRRDIELSVSSAVVFAFCAAFIMSVYDLGGTYLYTDLHKYGVWYLGVSFVVVLLLQDTYFYFIHRLFHHPLMFKWIHRGHHRSGYPTPWTSFAFDLPEAIVQAVFFAGIVFIIPLHFIPLVAALLTMTAWSVWNHLGIEVFPASSCRWLGTWLIGPRHHTIHHRKYTVHYGLYFTLWDKLLGTQDPTYDKD